MRLARWFALLLLVYATTPAIAQNLAVETLRQSAVVPMFGEAVESGDNCAGGLIYDDGIFENGIRLNTADGRLTQRIDLTGPAKLTTVCVCWQSVSSGDSAVSFNLQVYDTSGPGGVPGTLVASIPATASAIPNGLGGKFYRYDLGAQNINLSGNAYIGVQVNGTQEPGIYLCDDEGPLPARPAYASVNGGAFWGSMVSLNPLFEAFGLRAEIGEAGGCVPSETAMCLANNRFKVEAHYETAQSEGSAKVVKLTPDTGYLWFFSSSNVEAVIKVLDACALNQKFWVFAGGLTNVEVVVTITDTQTGTVKTYTNPQGTAFKPIQDTGAFACQ